ncbi:DNA repair protein RecO [Lachnospiraceae bacterium NSJ-143]|nr:DNA repair protein RecO [Lachnospiraceae bacterium NSJ-143]
MAEEKFDGIVLKEAALGETGKRLIVLAKDLGKITVSAKGAKSAKSRLNAPAQLFSYSSFTAYKNRNFYNASQGEIIESFYALRSDMEKFAYGSFICELTEKSVPEEMESNDVLHLLLMTFAVLSSTDFSPRLAAVIYEIKLLDTLGLLSGGESCSMCGADTQGQSFFNARMGGIICRDCSAKAAGSYPIFEGTRKAIEFVVKNSGKRIFAFSLSGEVLKQLEKVMEIYVRTHLCHDIKSLEFLKTMNI